MPATVMRTTLDLPSAQVMSIQVRPGIL
jgi:hypothetical protein